MTSKYGGYMGKVLAIDLSSQTTSEYPWSDEDRELYIGGKTMAAKILGDNLTKDTQPLSAENIIAITTGPFTGTGVPSSSRFNISTKSPQTDILTSSNCGGNFGYYLKKAGYDGLVIKGCCDTPVWIEIENDKVTFHKADDLWGMMTTEVQEALDEKLAEGNANTSKVKNGKIVIGPAGENLVRYASVISNERIAGRGGVGCVLGYKKLKAVTVTGNHQVQVHDRVKLDKLNKSWFRYLKNHPLCGDQLPRLGSAGLVSIMQMRGQLATRNYSKGQFEDFEKVSGEAIAEEYNIVNKGCVSCPMKCARTVEIDGKIIKGPELETLGLLGAGLMNNDLKAVLRWNNEMDEYGMDTISAANTLSYAMEAGEKGIWNNGLSFEGTGKEEISQLWHDIAYRTEIGDELANGSKWCSEKYGGKEFAIQSKGLELAAYEPRRSVGLGLGYAVSNRGGCHLNGGYMIIVEGLAIAGNQQTPKGKPDLTVVFQDLMESTSSCGQCLFSTYGFFPPPLLENPNSWYTRLFIGAMPHIGGVLRVLNRFPKIVFFNLPVIFNQSKALKYVTGMPVTFGSFLEKGKRGYTLERYINAGFGISSKDDTLPSRLTDIPQIDDDPSTKVPLEKMKKVYYAARGWNKDGIPTEKTLHRLKIKK